ncbi:hypothetical protein KVV02_005057 [Mortierella alpina]|uniref:G-protein coupled receptors family 2 profile 2 domain-containing protein n=1 Tax=Mortierella alpina TaxID=64518 RepID=A0A9P8CUL0_MORAP|nr:hypothetical protein KVV02_005057 [Mortierella alpina]
MTRIKTLWIVVWALPFSLFLTRPASPQNIHRAPSLSTTATNSLSSSISASTNPHASEATYFNLPPAELTFGFNNGTLDHCPGPLIHNIHNLDIPTCHGSCCIKCPAWKSFHEPNVVQHLLLAMYVVHQISLACKIFLVISYLVLPGKRGQPHTSVMLLFISDSMWFASFNIMPGISNSCVNDFEISTAQNSRSCGIQGVLIIYFIHTTVLWCSLLIYKLHMLAVWRSDIVERYFGWIAAFCWMFPLVFVVPVAAKGLAQFPGVGATCVVSHANLNTYLFYPTAAYFYPALLLHLFTASKMIHVAIASSKVDGNDGSRSELSLDPRPKRANRIQLKRLLRNQWRPALMLTLLTCCITFFWLYVFLENQHKARYSPKAPWIDGWLECLLMNDAEGATPFEAQAICAKQTASQRPSIILFGIVEMLVASSGIIIAVIFTAKAEFWTEWSSVLHNARSHGAFKSWMERRRRRSSTVPIMQNHEHDLNPHQLSDPKERRGSRVSYGDTPPLAFDIDAVKEHGHSNRRIHSDEGRTVGHPQHQMYLPGGSTSNAEPSPLNVDATAVPIIECLARPEKAYGDINSPSHEYEKQHVLPLPSTSNMPINPKTSSRARLASKHQKRQRSLPGQSADRITGSTDTQLNAANDTLQEPCKGSVSYNAQDCTASISSTFTSSI